jgi:hypothetical protein
MMKCGSRRLQLYDMGIAGVKNRGGELKNYAALGTREQPTELEGQKAAWTGRLVIAVNVFSIELSADMAVQAKETWSVGWAQPVGDFRSILLVQLI